MINMKTLICIASIVILLGCNHTESEQENTKSNELGKIEDVINKNYSILEIDSIKINNKFKYRSDLELLLEEFGHPDSVRTMYTDCGSPVNEDTVAIYFFERTGFWVNNNNAYIQLIDFRDEKIKLSYQDLELSNKTLASEIKKKVGNSPFDSEWPDESEIDTKSFQIRLLPKKNWDDNWILRFANGKLMQMEYWIPC